MIQGRFDFWQLQSDLAGVSLSGILGANFLLCLDTTCAILAVVLYDTFRVFLLNMGRRGWPLGKEESTAFKNSAPTHVFTFVNGGIEPCVLLCSVPLPRGTKSGHGIVLELVLVSGLV